MRVLVGLTCGALMLAGCGRAPAPEPARYRDVTRPIAAAALVDWGQFDGEWATVAGYPGACAGNRFGFGDSGVTMTCLDGQGAVLSVAESPVEHVGPGRMRLRLGPDFPANDFRVLWIAHDYETAVIGTPDGRAGWVLSRDGRISADRMAAAHEMLDFNGYDVSRLISLAS